MKVTLDAGPDGMKLTGNTLTWAVPAGLNEKSVSVILTVTDASGQEAFHTIDVPVTPAE